MNEQPPNIATEQTVSDRIKTKARDEVLSYAIFRPESALVVALSIILAGLSIMQVPWMPLPWWAWLIGGAVGEGAIVLSTLKDQRFYRYVLNKMFASQFDLKQLRSLPLRQKIEKALEYRQLLMQEILRGKDAHDERLLDTARGMEDWIAQIYRLAQNLDTYDQDAMIIRDLQNVPAELTELQRQRNRPMSASVQAELDKAVQMKQTHLETLNNLRDSMQKARLQLDNTLSAMGTIYMQAKLLGTREMNNNRAQRLQADMSEQVQQLQDTASAMDEIYRTNLRSKN